MTIDAGISEELDAAVENTSIVLIGTNAIDDADGTAKRPINRQLVF